MHPRITIVTPSYNQGQFSEATIDSVLSQCYPNLEYIVIDACSTDHTVELLRKYEKYLSHLIIEPDRGSADAINKGLRMASGTWFNWLNSDDVLMPGALMQLADHAQRWPERQWISGCKVNLDVYGSYVSSQAPWREDLAFWLFNAALFPQDATFIRTTFLRSQGIELDVELCNVYDTVLYLQLLAHAEPLLVSTVFSGMRWHADQKTANASQRALEGAAIQSASKSLPRHRRTALAQRLNSSRLSWLAQPLIITLARLNLWPSRLNWPVEQYDVWTRTYRSCRIRDCIGR